MGEITIGEILARQFARVWGTLRDALSRISDQDYSKSDCESLALIRIAYHLVETAEFYTNKSVDDGAPPLDWESGPVETLPTRVQLLSYLDKVEITVRHWLTSCGDATFLSVEPDFNDSGGTRLDRAIYSLRHAQHHLGQINSELRRKGLKPGKWG